MMIPSRSMIAFAAAALAAASAKEDESEWSETTVTVTDGEDAAEGTTSTSWWGELSGGRFILNRNQILLSDSPRIYYHCVGGTFRMNTRLVVSSPGVTYEEIAFDTSTWEDPPNDWNATLNNNIGQQMTLIRGPLSAGSVCICSYFQLNFYEWLKSQERNGSAIAFDFYQTPNFAPANWYNTGYLEPGQDVWTIREVYGGNVTLSFVNQGWYPPAKLSAQSSEPFTTTRKWLQIDDGGEPFVLRAMSENDDETDYELRVYLIEEGPDPILPEGWDRRLLSEAAVPAVYPSNGKKMFTSQTTDATQAPAFKFDAAPEGKYYAITIRNDGRGENTMNFEGPPTFECGPGENGVNTRYEVTFTFASCEEVECKGDVGDTDDPDNGAGHSASASAMFLLAGYLVVGIF